MNDQEYKAAMLALDELPNRIELYGVIIGLIEELIPEGLQVPAIRVLVAKAKQESRKI